MRRRRRLRVVDRVGVGLDRSAARGVDERDKAGDAEVYDLAGVPPAVSGTPEESLTGDGNGVKTGAKIVRHGRSITFQMAEVMISRGVFQRYSTPSGRCVRCRQHDSEG
jgi:hypothetical protein